MFLNEKPTCSICLKTIQDNETAIVEVRYPMKKGMTEIKAYLRNEGVFYCEICAKQTKRR